MISNGTVQDDVHGNGNAATVEKYSGSDAPLIVRRRNERTSGVTRGHCISPFTCQMGVPMSSKLLHSPYE